MSEVAAAPAFPQKSAVLHWKGLKILFYNSWKEGSAAVGVPQFSVML